ncbi:TPA: ead/Ea22-like family protein [Salmonella enterica subsp. enterica serovar Zanzibar]
MSKIDYQALREKAEKATCGVWSLEYGEGRFDGDDALIHREAAGYIPICRIEGAHPESGFDEDFQMEQQANAEFIAAANPATVLTLLGELETAKKRIAELEKGHQEAAKQINSWRRLAKQNIAERGKDISELEAARQRIAELEAKLETADKLQDSAFRDGLKAGFSYGQTDDQSGFMQCISAYSTRAGIGAKE